MMRHAVLLTALLVGCASTPRTLGQSDVRMPELRAEIARMVAADQEVQQEMLRRSSSGNELGPMDFRRRDSVLAVNTTRLRAILDANGWPGNSLVGAEGSHGVWLLLQHADEDVALQRSALVLLEKAVNAREASGSDLAYLTDRVRLAEGKLQVYGTQLQYDARGCASPKPSEYPAALDARRAVAGLMPMAEYLLKTMTALGRAAQCVAAGKD